METPQEGRAVSPRGRGLSRISLLAAAALVVVAVASLFGIARDYAYLHASLLTGTPMGNYHALGDKLAERARRGHGTLDVVATAGSVDNIQRLADNKRCSTMFAFVQAGTPVPDGAQLEVLGRLPEPETLLLFGKRGRTFPTFAELRGASIGIGPEGSGTAYLMRQLSKTPTSRTSASASPRTNSPSRRSSSRKANSTLPRSSWRKTPNYCRPPSTHTISTSPRRASSKG
jgi:hypothetical protein